MKNLKHFSASLCKCTFFPFLFISGRLATMCKRGRSPGLELRLRDLPTSPRESSASVESAEFSTESWSASYSSEMTRLQNSCVSSEGEETAEHANASSHELETRAMALVGCPGCLMYVMLSEVDPKCPKCNSTVFLDFFGQQNIKKTEN